MRCSWFLGCSLLSMFAAQALDGQISSIQRIQYGSPLIDSLPTNQFPRGGTYTAVIQGAGLKDVTGFVASDPNVTGTVSAVTDTAVTVQISSTPVKENQTASAPIPGVQFQLLQTPQTGDPPLGPILSPVTFDIVVGPPPAVTSWTVTNSVKWIPAGVATTVTYESTLIQSGNVQFFYIAGGFPGGNIDITSWNISCPQFVCTSDLTIVVTAPLDFSLVSFNESYGAVDGSGQGGIAGNAPQSPTKTLNVPIVQMQLVDPVTGGSATTLLSGPAITSDPNDLADQARGVIVDGVAADGVAQVVIRIAGAPPNETFSLNLAQDGGLAEIGSTDFQSSIPALQADSSGNAFVLYRAPLDFARAGGMDDAVVSRIVDLNFQSSDNPGTVGDTQITLVRPPVVLVHGNWSNAATDWQFFQFFESPAPVQTFRVDYSTVLAQGVTTSANLVLTQLPIVIAAFKSAAATVSGTPITVAAVQADLVAYSLGGLVSRALVTLPSFQSGSNYAAGYVHKLITLDTPHQGAELATALLASNAACRLLFAAKAGPVGQNIQDMAPGSALLKKLNAENAADIHLPTAVITSTALAFQQNDANEAWFNSPAPKVCPSLLPTGGYQALFTNATNPSGASDLIVSAYSQLATGLGVQGAIPSSSFSGVIHDVNPALFPTGPDARQSNIGVNQATLEEDRVGVAPPFSSTEQVLNLLNTPVGQFGKIVP